MSISAISSNSLLASLQALSQTSSTATASSLSPTASTTSSSSASSAATSQNALLEALQQTLSQLGLEPPKGAPPSGNAPPPNASSNSPTSSSTSTASTSSSSGSSQSSQQSTLQALQAFVGALFQTLAQTAQSATAGTSTSTTSGTALGQVAFIWDSTTSTRYFVDPTRAALGNTNRELSYVGALSDAGVAVGYYNTYSGTSSTVLSSNLFVWSEANGLQTLVTYSGSAASGSMTAFVSSFTFDSDGTLYGPNTYSGATSLVKYTPLLLGDANGDGKVDLTDLNIVLNNLGSTTSLRSNGNFDGAATIDLTDLNDVLNNLGTALPSAASAITATPEPASLSLLAASGILLLRRKKSH